MNYKSLLVILLSFSLLLSFSPLIPADTNTEVMLSDGLRVVADHETDGGGIILRSDYRQVNGKGGTGKALKLQDNNFVAYPIPYNRDIKRGWLELWFKPNDEIAGLVDFDTDSNEASYGIFLWQGTLHFEAVRGGSIQMRAHPTKMGKWNHLIVHWNSNQDKVTIYLNGQKTSTTFSRDMPSPGRRPVISLANHWYYRGSTKIVIDKFKIVKGTMTDQKAANLYNKFENA